jgi:ribonuclease HI
MNEKVIIYTDGASSGNPGPGGWGTVLKRNGLVRELGASEDNTTNNRMEMGAAIGALAATEEGDEIDLYTDSQYLINGITKWVHGWIKNNWQTKSKGDVLNKDLWQKLNELNLARKVTWIAVKGHAGVNLNNRVDEIAVGFSKNIKDGSPEPELFFGEEKDYGFKVEAPTEKEMNSEKTASNSRKGKKAYSYLSMVGGNVMKHSTWDDCKSRVDGESGAKFRKSLNAEDELGIIEEWKM